MNDEINSHSYHSTLIEMKAGEGGRDNTVIVHGVNAFSRQITIKKIQGNDIHELVPLSCISPYVTSHYPVL